MIKISLKFFVSFFLKYSFLYNLLNICTIMDLPSFTIALNFVFLKNKFPTNYY